MTKIFCYELRRLLWNQTFFGILAVSLLYGWAMLTGEVILGVSNTAPFSPWSFGYYLARLLPVICIGELFFITFFTSHQERRTKVITQATPVDTRRYAMMRCGAVLTGILLLCLCAVALCLVFYGVLFGYADFLPLLAPGLLTLFPALVFCLGMGWALGKLHPVAVYFLMVAVFLLSWLPLPQTLDLTLGSFFTGHPPELGTLDPAFSIPFSVLLGRAIYFVIGAAAFAWSQIGRYK